MWLVVLVIYYAVLANWHTTLFQVRGSILDLIGD